MAWRRVGGFVNVALVKSKPYPKTVLHAFGKNVARLRSEAGLTQEALAEKIDLNSRHLQKIEAGSVAPSFGSLYNLQKQLGVSWQDLLAGLE